MPARKSSLVLTRVMFQNPELKLTEQDIFGPAIANKIRFGMDISALDISYAELKIKSSYPYNAGSGTLNLGFLGLGPIFSFAPNKNIGLDAYVKALPTVSRYEYKFDDTTMGAQGFGFSGVLGFGLRARAFFTSIEYNWGKVDYTFDDDDELTANNLLINNFRICVGVKF